MRTIIMATCFAMTAILGACEKDKLKNDDVYGDGPKGNVSATMQGNWMYGFFSMTEYWNQNPGTYIGNGFEMAIAFTWNANGTYDHYFTSKTVSGGVATYHQSLTKGTVVINEASQTISTHANWAHYKQTKNSVVTEDRDLTKNEITKTTNYMYELRTEPDGTKAIYLKMGGAGNALPFLQKF